jgi:hypothetical protein
MTAYHCYIEHHEAVYAVEVEAGDAVTAAVRAAQKERIPGVWTVISGSPIEVEVKEITSYEGQVWHADT